MFQKAGSKRPGKNEKNVRKKIIALEAQCLIVVSEPRHTDGKEITEKVPEIFMEIRVR